MRFSRFSNRSNFSGLSSSYSNWNKSRIVRPPPQNKSLIFYLIIIFSTLITLQLYYMSVQTDYYILFRYITHLLILLFVGLLLYSAAKWIIAQQDKTDTRTIPIIELDDFENQKRKVTKLEIDKLKKDPRFSKLQKKSRKGSSSYEKMNEDDQEFLQDIQDNESQIFEEFEEQ